MVHVIVQEAGIKTIPKKKNFKKAKCLSEEALQIAERREATPFCFFDSSLLESGV